tara:strand:- start:549 stop:947 length:399 start_codon:yes stop_codon:yes gene_type:complete
MQTFKEALEQPHTFRNLFLGQLDEKCESIQRQIENLNTEATNYGMTDTKTMQLQEQVEMMEDFRYMIRDEDIENCSDPNDGDCDPGDFAPNYIEDENAEDILEKLFHGHELGYINIPESILFKIQTLLSHRN